MPGWSLVSARNSLLRFWPLCRVCVNLAEFQMQAWKVRPNTQSFLIFLFGLRHLAQHKIVFSKGLVSASRIGMGGNQGIDRTLRKKTTGVAQVVKQVRVVRAVWRAPH